MDRLYGDAHADTMAATMGLSNALRASGELDEAREMAERALRHYPEVFGDDHPFTHACRTNLALVMRLDRRRRLRAGHERPSPGRSRRTGRPGA